MLALGAALGGVVSGSWGIYPAFVIDALTFVVSAVFIARIAYRPATNLAQAQGTIGAALRQYAQGLRYLQGQRDTLAEQVFVIGEGGGVSLGLIYAVSGVGTGVGPILARRFTGDRDRRLRVAIGLSYLVGALGLSISAPANNFAVFLLGNLLRGIGGGVGWVFSSQLLLQTVPNHVRGRVFSTEHAMFTLLNACGAAIGGWALDSASVSTTGLMGWMAGLTLLPAALWAWWINKRDRS